MAFGNRSRLVLDNDFLPKTEQQVCPRIVIFANFTSMSKWYAVLVLSSPKTSSAGLVSGQVLPHKDLFSIVERTIQKSKCDYICETIHYKMSL